LLPLTKYGPTEQITFESLDCQSLISNSLYLSLLLVFEATQ